MTARSNLQTSYDAHLRLFRVRWLVDTRGSSLQADYEALLAAAAARHAVRWLLDVRQRPTPSIEAVNWVTLNWMPRLAALTAPGHLCVAYVISSQRAEALALDPELAASVNDALAPNRYYQMGVFGTEEEALQWLLV